MVKKLKTVLAVIMLFSLVTGGFLSTKAEAYESKNVNYVQGVSCYKQSTVRIKGKKTIYFDPLMFEGSPKDGDIVFISHSHGDHFSADDIRRVIKKNGTLVITADINDQAIKEGFKKIITVMPGKSYKVNGISFKTTAAYNINKDFHKKESKWVGYNVTMDNKKYYFAGDTDLIPEMKKIKADVAFLPVGGTYTMDASEAAKAANIIKPKVAVPIHFGDVVGTTSDAGKFVNLLDKEVKGMVLKNLLNGVSHYKQSTIKITADKTMYFDPYNISGEPKDADIIFISHSHGDHFSVPDIKKVMKDTASLVAPADVAESLKKEGFKNIQIVEPLKDYTVDGIKFSTVPAYNLNKEFHKKESKWVGYIVNVNNTRYYFAGDTDNIPEMKDINADVVFLPVGGTYTMTAKEAAEAANSMKPLAAVPIHYADVVGTKEDAKTFVKLLNPSINGVILKKD